MRVRHLICAFLLTLAAAGTVYGADYAPQTVTMFAEPDSEGVIELNGSKVITDDFSFKMPENWKGGCVMIPSEDSLEIYDKAAYEDNGEGLLFVITVYEDSSYLDLDDYSILSFCENKTYVLENCYTSTLEDEASPEYKDCEKTAKALKKSFVSFVKED